jgi:hypothetical protein
MKIVRQLLLVVIGAAVSPASAQYTAEQCFAGFAQFAFDVTRFDLYPIYFKNDSTVVLPQGGIFTGPDDIEEYIRFLAPSSPHISSFLPLAQAPNFKSVDPETGTCEFLAMQTAQYSMNPETALNSTFNSANMSKMRFELNGNYLSAVFIYYPQSFVDFLWGKVFATSRTLDFMCSVMRDNCPDIDGAKIGNEECTMRLAELPIHTNGNIDGLDQGCRVLHSVFASTNNKHCPHLAFESTPDAAGNVVCQESANTNISDYFDEQDLEVFMAFTLSNSSYVEDSSSIKVIYLEETSSEAPTKAPTASSANAGYNCAVSSVTMAMLFLISRVL